MKEAQSLRASYYDAVIAGSSWNARGVARSLKRHGVSIGPKEKVGVHAVLQGVRTMIKSPLRSLSSTQHSYDTGTSQRIRIENDHPTRIDSTRTSREYSQGSRHVCHFWRRLVLVS